MSETTGAGRYVPEPDAPVSDADIARLLRHFYAKVRRDDLLGPVFARVVGESDAEWAAHLSKLGDFWSSVMRRSGRYHGDPFSAHLRLPDLAPPMFERWLALFHETCAELFDPFIAEAFGVRAERIGRSLRMGLFEREIPR